MDRIIVVRHGIASDDDDDDSLLFRLITTSIRNIMHSAHNASLPTLLPYMSETEKSRLDSAESFSYASMRLELRVCLLSFLCMSFKAAEAEKCET